MSTDNNDDDSDGELPREGELSPPSSLTPPPRPQSSSLPLPQDEQQSANSSAAVPASSSVPATPEAPRERAANEPPSPLGVDAGQRQQQAQAQAQEGLSSIHPQVLIHLQRDAEKVAGGLNAMLSTFSSALHQSSDITKEALTIYQQSIENISTVLDDSIKNMYSLMVRCDELDLQMKPIEQMALQIKAIRKTLDVFEAACK